MAFCTATSIAALARATQVLHLNHLLPIGGAILALALPTMAQSLKELRLKDGRVLVGKVSVKGDKLDVSTGSGNFTVAQTDVAATRSGEQLLRDLRKKAKTSGNSAFAHLNLAKLAREYGLTNEMWRHLDQAIAKLAAASKASTQPNNPTAKRLQDFLSQLGPEVLPRKLHQAPLTKRIQKLLRLVPANTSVSRAAAIEELMVREPGADQYLRQEARRNSNQRQRIAALSALQRRKNNGNHRFVLRTTVLDPSQKVRDATINLCKQSVQADDIQYMASGLAHSSPKVRIRTAEALGKIGHQQAIPLLAKAAPYAASGLAKSDNSQTRAHVAFIKQQAYIRDFDVEVASAAFVADPKVDALISGSVLDVTVTGVYEVRTILTSYRKALKQLTKRDPGPDPSVWSQWVAALPKPPKPVQTGK